MNIDITVFEFIEARIAEDEKQAHGMLKDLEVCPPSAYDMAQVPTLDAGDPGRVLAECEMKRHLLGMADSMSADVEFDQLGWQIADRLSAIWSDHEDYNPGWRT